MPNLKPTPAFAVVDKDGKLNSRGNGHEWQYPLFYKRNRPEGANGFLDRNDDLSDADVRPVVIVDAREYRQLVADQGREEALKAMGEASAWKNEVEILRCEVERLKGKADA